MQPRSSSYLHIPGGLLIIGLLLIAGCDKNIAHEGKVVFTQVPVNSVELENINAIESKYAPAMKIALAEIGEGLESIEVLSADFSSARSPEISFDGLKMVFSGQKEEGDPWQIWVMNLEKDEVFQVTESRTNCTDPTWLPNGSIAFSKLVTDEKSLKYHALYTIGADGCCEERITFQPHEDINASLLHDGRILVASKRVYPEEGQFKYLALRPDGTKAEVFHLSNSEILGKAVEINDRVMFSESGNITVVNFARPLHTKNVLTDQYKISSIFNMEDYNLVLSVKKPPEKTFGLAMYNYDDLGKEILYFNDSEYHVTEAIVVKDRPAPRNLPSRVNPEMNEGYVFSMNADASDIEAQGKTAKVQVLGMNDVIGETSVAEDGSFYLKLAADRPIRLQTLDGEGEILRGPSSWMWVRPNERRGCVGCHQDREVSPGNIVPRALEKAPITMMR